MDVVAKLRFLRMSPRKVRLVVDLIRGKDILTAQAQLAALQKWAARPVLKLLNSAVANAEHNFKLKSENLFVKRITADEGPSLKRYRPKAFGRADTFKKRMTHVTIILGEKAGSKLPRQRTARQPAPPVVPAGNVRKQPTTRIPEEKKLVKRSRLSRVKELGSKIVHRRGND